MFQSNLPTPHALLICTTVIWIVFEVRQSLQRRPEAKSADQGSINVVRLAYVVGIAGSLACRNIFPHLTISSDFVSSWLAFLFMLCGVVLRIWSFQTLGRYFTFTVQTSMDQPVISNGPYRAIRHPGYTGLLLAISGVGLSIGNWASFVILVGATSCGLIYRIKVEERALARDLGGRYEAFAKNRKRLIPFLW